MSVFDSYVCDNQMNLFEMDKPKFYITKPLRLIELFAGVGSQAMSVRDLGVDFEHYRVVEFDKYAIKSYNAIHSTNFSTTDIRTISGSDLGIVDTEHFTYLLTYLLISLSRFICGRKRGRYDKRKWNTLWSSVGS